MVVRAAPPSERRREPPAAAPQGESAEVLRAALAEEAAPAPAQLAGSPTAVLTESVAPAGLPERPVPVEAAKQAASGGQLVWGGSPGAREAAPRPQGGPGAPP